MNFLENAWYVAAWGHEVTDQLFSRRLFDQPVLIYRKTDGSPVAILDRCPHRFAPLSRGRVVGDFVECGYHGLQFNGAGACVLNPHGSHVIPKAAKVRSFPLVERYDILWIWPGDPALADPATIPDYGYLVGKSRKTIYGGMLVKANYELIIDNLMDASHTQYVHMDLLGTDAFTRSKHEVVQEGDTVYSKYLIPNGEIPEAYKPYFEDRTQMVDYRVNFRWQAPSLVRNSVSLTPVGKTIEEGVQRTGTHLMTPETDTTAHYFFCHTRNFQLDDAVVDERIRQWQKSGLTDQDGAMIQHCQERMGTSDLHSLHPVLLSIDAAAVRVRRVLAKLIRAEREARSSSAAVSAPTQASG